MESIRRMKRSSSLLTRYWLIIHGNTDSDLLFIYCTVIIYIKYDGLGGTVYSKTYNLATILSAAFSKQVTNHKVKLQ